MFKPAQYKFLLANIDNSPKLAAANINPDFKTINSYTNKYGQSLLLPCVAESYKKKKKPALTATYMLTMPSLGIPKLQHSTPSITLAQLAQTNPGYKSLYLRDKAESFGAASTFGQDSYNKTSAYELTDKIVKTIPEKIVARIKKRYNFSFFENFDLLVKLKEFYKLQPITSPSYLNYNLIRLINYIDRRVPLIFSIYKQREAALQGKKLGFISKDISLISSSEFTPSVAKQDKTINSLSTKTPTQLSVNSGLLEIGSSELNLAPSLQLEEQRSTKFNESFNNLVFAKSTIIGKIKSIKLIELIDRLKEQMLIAAKLAANKRINNITPLKLKNKKKLRHINATKYVNKKNIKKNNKNKILQTIKTTKTDFIFDLKLDSHFSEAADPESNIPVPLLYYSNLIPVNLVTPAKEGSSNVVKIRHKGKALLPLQQLQASATTASRLQGVSASLQRTGDGWGYAPLTPEEKPPVLNAYLKELSIYNRETKGVINYFSKFVSYNFNTNNNKISSSINDLLEAAFKVMRCLISKPVFVITPDKITIQLFYFLMVANKKVVKKKYRNRHKRRIYSNKRLFVAKKFDLFSLIQIFPEQFKLLCARLNKIFNKSVEFNLIRLRYPSEDSNILANFIDILINKVKSFKIFKKVFKGTVIKSLTKLKAHKYNNISIIPAFLTGLNIKVAGRIMTKRIKPRKTISALRRRGATASGKINYLNFARLTNKNKRGSYSITINAGQNLFK